MQLTQTTNEKDFKEFLITTGKFKGYYISYWKNEHQHIDLMENATATFGECLYITKQKNNLTASEIKTIAKAVLIYKELKEF